MDCNQARSQTKTPVVAHVVDPKYKACFCQRSEFRKSICLQYRGCTEECLWVRCDQRSCTCTQRTCLGTGLIVATNTAYSKSTANTPFMSHTCYVGIVHLRCGFGPFNYTYAFTQTSVSHLADAFEVAPRRPWRWQFVLRIEGPSCRSGGQLQYLKAAPLCHPAVGRKAVKFFSSARGCIGKGKHQSWWNCREKIRTHFFLSAPSKGFAGSTNFLWKEWCYSWHFGTVNFFVWRELTWICLSVCLSP